MSSTTEGQTGRLQDHKIGRPPAGAYCSTIQAVHLLLSRPCVAAVGAEPAPARARHALLRGRHLRRRPPAAAAPHPQARPIRRRSRSHGLLCMSMYSPALLQCLVAEGVRIPGAACLATTCPVVAALNGECTRPQLVCVHADTKSFSGSPPVVGARCLLPGPLHALRMMQQHQGASDARAGECGWGCCCSGAQQASSFPSSRRRASWQYFAHSSSGRGGLSSCHPSASEPLPLPRWWDNSW